MTAKSQVKFGLVGSINESTLLKGNEINYHLTGFDVGIASEVNLSRHFYLFPELVLITRGQATWFADHDYQIRGDKDFDAELIICFCLICDHLKNIQRKASA